MVSGADAGEHRTDDFGPACCPAALSAGTGEYGASETSMATIASDVFFQPEKATETAAECNRTDRGLFYITERECIP